MVPGAKIDYQSFTGGASQPGSVVRFSCLNNQEMLAGSDSVICGNDGLWSTLPTTCISCGMAPSVVNAKVAFQDFKADQSQPRSIARYACLGNLQIIGLDMVTCGSDGFWTKPPTCSSDGCGPVPAVPFSMIVKQSFAGPNGSPGDSVTYSCNSGSMTGSPVLTCDLASLKWKPDPPTCYSKKATSNTCGLTPALLNGFVSASSVDSDRKTANGDYVYYSCNTGYILIGSATVQCTAGSWTAMPTCAASCGSAGPAVPRAEIVSQSFSSYATIGDTVEYRCNTGYVLTTSSRSKIICQNNYLWTPTPICVVSKAVTARKPEKQVVFATESPHSMGVQSQICVGTTGVGCPACGEPPAVPNAFEVKRTFTDDGAAAWLDGVAYECNANYQFQGSLTSIFCQSETPCHWVRHSPLAFHLPEPSRPQSQV